jgi:ABC-type oligopeptide transport system ATPase subunit
MESGFQFQAVDLRWGVSDEAIRDQQTMRICLDEIERCQKTGLRPNFIVLLGDRYGSRPLPPEIPDREFEAIKQHVSGVMNKALLKKWYQCDNNADPPVYCLQPQLEGRANWEVDEPQLHALLLQTAKGILTDDEYQKYTASATEQEIVRGALQVADASKHVFGFFRTIKDLPHDQRAEDFIDLDDAYRLDIKAHQQLQDLKDRLRTHLCMIYDYPVTWAEISTATYKDLSEDDYDSLDPITKEHIKRFKEYLDKLCEDVYNSLASIIKDQIAQFAQTSPWENEIQEHNAFGKELAKIFIGRSDLLQKISDYVREVNRQPLAIIGESGSGKSALLAHAVAQLQRDYSEAIVIARYIGATPGSSDGRSLLESLCRQIASHYEADEATIPKDYQSLVQDFPKRLAVATKEKPLIVFLDALDQLTDTNNARNLTWLPADLPGHVRLIVSTLPGESLIALENKFSGGEQEPLTLMTVQEGSQLLDCWLHDAHPRRTLQPKQRTEILDKFQQCGLPLYLKLAFEQARHWHSYDEVPNLGGDIPGIITDLFAFLSKGTNHGEVMVSHSLGYLAAAKKGLTEEELLGVLSTEHDHVVMKNFRERSPQSPIVKKLPMIIWSRLYFDLRPYLTEHNVDGISLMTFFHRQVGEVAAQSYLTGAEKIRVHCQLAKFFTDHLEDPQQTCAHALVETPYHLVNSEQEEEAAALLCQLQYVDDRCQWCDVYELLEDYGGVHNITQEKFGQYRDFVRKHAQRLARYPGAFFTLVQQEGFQSAKKAAQELVTDGQWRKPWIETIPAWIPSPSQARGSMETPDVLAQVEFDERSIVELAQDVHIAFYLRSIEEIGMIDLTRGRELANIIPIHRSDIRPLALTISPDAEFLAIAFVNGEADLLHLHSSETSNCIEQLKTFTYLPPEFEAPIMVFAGNVLWYQAESGKLGRLLIEDGIVSQSFVDLPPVTGDGELSGICVIDEQVVITMRQQNNTTIIALTLDGRSVSLRFANARFACLTPCGPKRVALALKSNHIAVVEIGSEVTQVSDLLVDEFPSCMTMTGSDLLWISKRNTMHTWTTRSQDTARTIENPSLAAFHARRLVRWKDGTFGLVTTTKAVRFNLTTANTPGKYPIRAVFDASRHGKCYYAVQERPDGLWFLNGVMRSQVHLIEGSPETLQKYAMDGASHLFGIGANGRGFLMDIGSQIVRRLEDLPLNVLSVVGSPTGGFWLIDMTGVIFFLAPDGTRYASCRVKLKDIGQSEIHCWPGLLLWKGICLHDNGIGEETTNASIFFQPVGSSPGALRVLGQRFFVGIGGVHQLVAFNAVQEQMWIISSTETLLEYSIMSGTPQDFIEQREQKQRVSGIDQLALAARITHDGTGLYLLCMSGTLFRLDTATMEIKAILCGSLPITSMVQSESITEPFALVAGHVDLYHCVFHDRSRK